MDYFFNECIPLYDELWLFGTNKYAMAFTRYLRTCGINMGGYVVSNASGKCIEGKKLLLIDEFKKYRNTKRGKIALLLTIHSKYYGEVYPTKEKLDKTKLIFTDRYEDEVYDSLSKKGIEQQNFIKLLK